MKRKLFLLSIFVICAAMLSAGSFAYFSAEGKAHNVITTGGVAIEILEWADEEKTTPFTNPQGIMPGTSVTKIAEVKNSGNADAWIRVRVTKTVRASEELDSAPVELKLNTADWTQRGGYLYYNKAVKPGETTAPVFTAVTFRRDMGNAYQNATATVDVDAQAVQTANNGTSALDALGWQEEA